ncbi:MAG: LCP family protein [Coriobacteriia bacterium]|nr:LCP family protein [Coriobacteriia bacterium]
MPPATSKRRAERTSSKMDVFSQRAAATKRTDSQHARSELLSTLGSYSRSAGSLSYAKQRRKRATRKRILTAVLATLLALLVSGIAVVLGIIIYINGTLHSNLDLDALNAATVDRGKPDDPFWVLLVGSDEREEGEIARTDTIILARIDPGKKTAALVSIPRDTRVEIPNYGYEKINAAYAYGSMEELQNPQAGRSGPQFAVNAVSELTGIGIHGYLHLNFNGFEDVVNALGGVEVDVPLDIYNNFDRYGVGYGTVYPAIAQGVQVLDAEHALLFVRSRYYQIGDYQRQANQRTFLQAMARQVLASDPVTIINTVTQLCQMTTSNFDATEIASIANSLRGMRESDIYTYSIPAYSDMIDGISFEIPDVTLTRELLAMIDKGEFPDAEELGLLRQGESPDSYKPLGVSVPTDNLSGAAVSVTTSKYTVDVRNGYGIAGSATATAEMLTQAGYKLGEVGNANSFVYKETLIIYQKDESAEAAEDIRGRLGFGRVIPSLERYAFSGDILVVVGEDFQNQANIG